MTAATAEPDHLHADHDEPGQQRPRRITPEHAVDDYLPALSDQQIQRCVRILTEKADHAARRMCVGVLIGDGTLVTRHREVVEQARTRIDLCTAELTARRKVRNAAVDAQKRRGPRRR